MTGTTPTHGLPYPQSTDPPDGPAQIQALATGVENAFAVIAPVGSILMWPTATAPTGWLICNGATFSAATYPALNTVLGGTTLPDLRGRFPIGKAVAGTGSTLLGAGGAIDHTHTGPSHTHIGPSHTHSVDPPTTTSSVDSGEAAVQNFTTDLDTVADKNHTHTVNIAAFSSALGGAAATSAAGTGATGISNPPYLALNFIVRAA